MPRLLALVLMVLALSLPRMAQAHFIWIEAESVGKLDAPVEISLFYGEPHEFLREESPGNLDRHAGLQAWVVDPSGERSSLTLRKEKNRFVTSFRPTRVGRHTILSSSTDVTPVDRKRTFWRTESTLSTSSGALIATASIVFRGGADYSERQMAYFKARTPPGIFRRMFPNYA
jgi:hypothetical protein